MPRIEEVVDAFIKSGVKFIVVSNTISLRPSELRYLLELVLKNIDDLKGLCNSELFICYGGI